MLYASFFVFAFLPENLASSLALSTLDFNLFISSEKGLDALLEVLEAFEALPAVPAISSAAFEAVLAPFLPTAHLPSLNAPLAAFAPPFIIAPPPAAYKP